MLLESQILDAINADFTRIDQFTDQDKWLELRKTGIGGSDAGAIMGMNKYASPLTIYMSKKGVDGFKGNASTEWGHILEDPIRKKAEEELKIEIYTIPGMFTSVEYPWMNANLDGFINAKNPVSIGGETVQGYGGHEIKTSATGEGFGEDEIPDSYYCQVQHYMAVTSLDWFILTVFFLNTKKGRHYIIRKNGDFIYTQLIPAERDFWENYVIPGNIPSPAGVDSENEYLKNLPIDSTVTLDEETESLIAEEQEYAEKEKEYRDLANVTKEKIILKLHELSKNDESSEKITGISEKYRVSYNLQVRKSIDGDLLKKDGLYEQYVKTSSSRVMRISEIRK